MRNFQNTKKLMMIVSVAMLVFSCTKKRDDALPYGVDRDLESISKYENSEWDLKTIDLFKSASTGAKVLVNDDRSEKTKVTNLDFVKYKAEDPLNLLDNTTLIGRANFSYKVKYVFEGSLLKVMKVSKPEDLSYDERVSAKELSDGRMMVPIVSYNVSYYTIDNSRNDRNEKTSKLELIDQKSRDKSTHFKIDFSSKTVASFLSKTMVLPSDFFSGADSKGADWYFSLMVLKQNYINTGHVGSLISLDKYGREAGKVRIKKTEDKLIFYNLAIDERLSSNLSIRDENQAPVVTIPVEFLDYRFVESGKNKLVKEESHKENAWDKRAFAQMSLKDTVFPLGDLKIREVKDIQIDQGYFSFTVYSDTLSGLVKISLYNTKSYEDSLKAPAQGATLPYKPKVYFPEDQKLFGFFKTEKELVSSFESSRKSVADKAEFVNRYNPTRSFVEFRLNQDAPAWTEEIVKNAAAAWNASFKEAGLKMRVRSTDASGKVLRGTPGDLRYSLINMYDEIESGGGWGGLGPSLVDAQTGEIIMGTANINIPDRLYGFEISINNYLLAAKGLLDDKYILGVPLPSVKVLIDKVKSSIKVVSGFIGFNVDSDYLTNFDSVGNKFNKKMQISDESKVSQKINFTNQKYFEERFDFINGNIVKQIEAVCPEVHNYAKSLSNKNQQVLSEEAEIKLIKSCSLELAKPSIMTVVLHEMGHNFGLRHNFFGSADKRNFYAPVDLQLGKSKFKTQWKTSSVMDYVSLNYENIVQPGLYDTAAIRWGYLDQVEDLSKNIHTLKPELPATKQISNLQAKVRPFLYCTDEDVDILGTDPMCARSDVGSDPVEVVTNLIAAYDASVALQNNRLDRKNSNDTFDLAYSRSRRFFVPMKKFYEKWRTIVGAKAGPGREYLESFDDAQNYSKLVDGLIDEKVVGKEQAEFNSRYYKASAMIYDFLTRVAFYPDYTCIATEIPAKAKNAEKATAGQQADAGDAKKSKAGLSFDGKLNMYSFSGIQKNIYALTGKTVISCRDQDVSEYLQKKFNQKLVAEGGKPYRDLYADLSESRVNKYYDEVNNPEINGLVMDRYFAMLTLVKRTQYLHETRVMRIAPNFVDDPIFQKLLGSKLLSRLTEGLSPMDLGLDISLNENLKNTYGLLFEEERTLLSEMFMMYKFVGLHIPGKEEITNQRLLSFAMIPIFDVSVLEKLKNCLQSSSGVSFCAPPQATVSIQLIKAIEKIKKTKESVLITNDGANSFFGIATAVLPAPGQAATLDFSFYDRMITRVKAAAITAPHLSQEFIRLMSVFDKEKNIWESSTEIKIQKIMQEDISKAEKEKKIEDLKKIKLTELAANVGDTQYKGLDHDLLRERIDKFLADELKNNKFYKQNSSELDSQEGLLKSIILNGNY